MASQKETLKVYSMELPSTFPRPLVPGLTFHYLSPQPSQPGCWSDSSANPITATERAALNEAMCKLVSCPSFHLLVLLPHSPNRLYPRHLSSKYPQSSEPPSWRRSCRGKSGLYTSLLHYRATLKHTSQTWSKTLVLPVKRPQTRSSMRILVVTALLHSYCNWNKRHSSYQSKSTYSMGPPWSESSCILHKEQQASCPGGSELVRNCFFRGAITAPGRLVSLWAWLPSPTLTTLEVLSWEENNNARKGGGWTRELFLARRDMLMKEVSSLVEPSRGAVTYMTTAYIQWKPLWSHRSSWHLPDLGKRWLQKICRCGQPDAMCDGQHAKMELYRFTYGALHGQQKTGAEGLREDLGAKRRNLQSVNYGCWCDVEGSFVDNILYDGFYN